MKAKRQILPTNQTSRERKPNRYQYRKRSSIYSGKPSHWLNLYRWLTLLKNTKKYKYIRHWHMQMQSIWTSIASLNGKFTNSSGRKTVAQALRDDLDPLEISELAGHTNPESISSQSHNSLEKQRLMSNKLADNYQQLFKSCFTGDCSQQLSPAKQHIGYW